MKKTITNLNDTLVETKAALEAEINAKTAHIDELKQQKVFAKKMARLWAKRAEALDAEIKATRKVIRKDKQLIAVIEEQFAPTAAPVAEVVEKPIEIIDALPETHLPQPEDITPEEETALVEFCNEAVEIFGDEVKPVRKQLPHLPQRKGSNREALKRFVARKR